MQNLSTAELTEAFQRNGVNNEHVVVAEFVEMADDEAVYKYSAGYGHESLLAVRDCVNGLHARKYDIISRAVAGTALLATDVANGTANVVTSVPPRAAGNVVMDMLDVGLDFLARKTMAAGKVVEDLGGSTLEKVSDLGESALSVLPDTSTVEAAGEFVTKLGSGALNMASSVGEGALGLAEGVGSVVGGIAEAAGDIASGL